MDPSLYEAAARGDIEVLKRFKHQVTQQLTSLTHNTFLHVLAQFGDASAPLPQKSLFGVHYEDPVRYPDHSEECDKASAQCVGEMLRDQSSEAVQSLLTWKNSAGETPLYIAARNKCINIVREIIDRAKALDEIGGGDEVTKNMLRLANENGDTALHEAVKNKDLEMVRLLVKHDPDFEHLPNHMGETPLYLAIERIDIDNQSFDIAESILTTCSSPGFRGPGGETTLHAAARSYKASSLIPRIIEKKKALTKQVDDQGLTPLHHAASYHGSSLSAKELLKADKSVVYARAKVEKHEAMTPLHLATSNDSLHVMSDILRSCPDCWELTTSNGQNILHLAAYSPHNYTAVNFIMRQPWAINLINHKDNRGNTPFHILVSSAKRYEDVITFLNHPIIDLKAVNMEGSTPSDIVFLHSVDETSTRDSRRQQSRILSEIYKRGGSMGLRNLAEGKIRGNSRMIKEESSRERVEEMRRKAETHLVVAALIATVTFAAGFTLPGGYDGNEGPNQGMAVLIRKAAFKAFVLTDVVAFISSCAAIFLHFAATFYKHDEDVKKLFSRYLFALLFLIISMITMVLALVTGLFCVLEKTLWLAIVVCVIGCIGLLFLFYLVGRAYHHFRIVSPSVEIYGALDILRYEEFM